ncbi:MAG: SDR family oxidoreductase [Pseudomonadota bacterium]
MTAKRTRALVTGASSGIGRAAAVALAASGRQVLAVGRRRAALLPLAEETGCQIAVADICDRAAMAVVLDGFAPDILVNNAGVGHGISGLDTVTAAQIESAVATNVTATLNLTAAALPAMRRAGRGHIVTIGSIAGLHTNISAVYGATKAALHRFSQNLRYELLGSGVRVTEICPGRVSTEFYQAAEGDPDRIAALGQSGIRELDPADIAAALLYAVDAPEHVNVATIEILPTAQAVGGVATARS